MDWISNYYPNVDVFTIISDALNLLLFIVVILAVIYLSLAGLKYIMSGGDAGKTKEAQAAIVNVIIGLVVAFGAYFIVQFVLQRLGVDQQFFEGNTSNSGGIGGTVAAKHMLAYIQEGNIYYSEIDGSNARKLTSDASATTRYMDISWKNSREVSYTRCAESCAVITKNIKTNSEVNEFSLTASSLVRIQWSPDEKHLAFLRKSDAGKIQAGMKTAGEEVKVLKEFGTVNGELTLDDSFGLSFSPDSKYLVVSETMTQNLQGFNSIVVFEMSGKEFGVRPTPAKFAAFVSKDTFVYSETQVLKNWNVTNSGMADKIAPFGGYELQSISNQNRAVYWQFESSSQTAVYLLVNGTTATATKKAAMFHSPAMYTEDEAMALITDTLPEQKTYPLPNKGIGKINLTNGATSSVVGAKVERFAVSPAK